MTPTRSARSAPNFEGVADMLEPIYSNLDIPNREAVSPPTRWVLLARRHKCGEYCDSDPKHVLIQRITSAGSKANHGPLNHIVHRGNDPARRAIGVRICLADPVGRAPLKPFD